MRSGSGALLHPLYRRLENQQSGKPLHSRPIKHWQTKSAMVETRRKHPEEGARRVNRTEQKHATDPAAFRRAFSIQNAAKSDVHRRGINSWPWAAQRGRFAI